MEFLSYERLFAYMTHIQANPTISDAKIKILFWIFTHVNDDLQIVDDRSIPFITQQYIAEHTNLPLITVKRILNMLQCCDPPIIIHTDFGQYSLNPVLE